MSIWKHRKNCVVIASQKRTERSTENGAGTACSCALQDARSYSFFTAQNKSVVEIYREVCLRHRRIIYIDIQLPYTEHTRYEFQPLICFVQ